MDLQLNFRCAYCHTPSSSISTHCNTCGIDTGGYAECMTCSASVYQLDIWKSGNKCPCCVERTKEMVSRIRIPAKSPRKTGWWQKIMEWFGGAAAGAV